MESFTKVVRIGTMLPPWRKVPYSIFCEIKFVNGADGNKLSITGVEGPTAGGNCVGSCGQIEMHLKDELDKITPAPGWDAAKIEQFFKVWDRWHLNDMKAGSAVQEQYLRDNPIDKSEYQYPKSYFDAATKALKAAGLNPDASGYKYGHAWKREDVPDEVIEFLKSLPDTDKKPAWV